MYTHNTPSPSYPSSPKRKHVIVGTAIRVNGKTVGQVIGDEYQKDITSAHILKKFPSIANDVSALHDAERAGARWCVFTNTQTGIVYRVSIATIWEKGQRINFTTPQIALELSYWMQSRGAGYIIPIDPPTGGDPHTSGAAMDDSPSGDVQPFTVKSKAITGVHYKAGKQTPKQMSLFGR
jgi:hypothetical protein